MGILAKQGVESVNHYAPLHYLIFIARSNAILCKPSLKKAGFDQKHCRSMSHKQDVARGFGDYAHLTLDAEPRILLAKLAAGFPHVAIVVPVAAIDSTEFSLCRFNVAMTRRLRRGGKPGFAASDTNGRYYLGHQIPIARTDADKTAMLRMHLNDTMIEVLVHGDLKLPKNTTVVCFSKADAQVASSLLKSIDCTWSVVVSKPPGAYPRDEAHVKAVSKFIAQAQADPAWRGDGLEFDRLRAK